MKMPQLNIGRAIKAYYTLQELSTEDIQNLFEDKIGSTRMRTLKNKAREKTAELNKIVFSAYNVNTICAFLAWGYDITELERSYNRLKKLGLLQEEAVQKGTET